MLVTIGKRGTRIETDVIVMMNDYGDHVVMIDIPMLGNTISTISEEYTNIKWCLGWSSSDTPKRITITAANNKGAMRRMMDNWEGLNEDQLDAVKKRDLREHVIECIKEYLLTTGDK